MPETTIAAPTSSSPIRSLILHERRDVGSEAYHEDEGGGVFYYLLFDRSLFAVLVALVAEGVVDGHPASVADVAVPHLMKALVLVQVAGFDEVIGIDDEADLAKGNHKLLFVVSHQGFHHVLALFVAKPDLVLKGIGYEISEILTVFQQFGGIYSFF